MTRRERLQQLAEPFRQKLQDLAEGENLLDEGDRVEISVSIETPTCLVSCTVSDHKLSVNESSIHNEQLEQYIDEINWSTRARKCLNRGGIKTLGDLKEVSARELLKIRNFGKITLREVRSKLAEYGLKLKGD